MSLAGEAAAEAREKAARSMDGSSLKLGSFSLGLSAGLDFEANDNIRFASTEGAFDFISRPQVNARMAWPLSERNDLSLALGAGYSFYAQYSEFNRLFIAPGSELSFDLYAGDVWLNFHERLSIAENSYTDPTVVGSADYSQLQNNPGLSFTWDLNQVVLRLSYDRTDYWVVSGSAGFPDGNSDVLALSAGYRGNAVMTFGLESGGGWIRYGGDSTQVKEAIDWNVGTFIEAQPTEYISVKAAAGYTVYAPQTSTPQSALEEFTGVYARLELKHRLNRFVEYRLSGGRSITFGFFAGTIDLYTAILDAQWHLFQKLSLGTGFQFEHGSDVLAGSETFDRFGPRVSLERPITVRMSGVLRYQYYQRQSDVPNGDYRVNLVTLGIAYRF